MRHSLLLAASALFLFAAGCADDDTEDQSAGAGFTWTAGSFQVVANGVNDGCLDGAANDVAIPGRDSNAMATRTFTNPMPFPGSAELPKQISVTLVAPFKAATTTVKRKTEGSNVLVWDPPATNTDVDLGELESAWSGCKADFEFTGEWTAQEASGGDVKFDGVVGLRVTKTNGNAACPVAMAKLPCTVGLTAIATRK